MLHWPFFLFHWPGTAGSESHPLATVLDIHDRKTLLKRFTDKSRKPALVGNKVILPKVIDDQGEIITIHSSPSTRYELSIPQAQFLQAYEESNLDLETACVKTGKTKEWALRFLKTRNKNDQPSHPYLDEKNKLDEIAKVATPAWTKATLAMGVTGEYLAPNENAAKFLSKLADINFPKAQANIQINNVNMMPKLTPEQERSAREFFDKMADVA